jgi:exodeoxyribonuclease VII large subunit
MLEQRILGLNPEVLLKRGYSITKMGDKVLHNAMQVQEGDVLTTRLEHGEVLSKVICRLG